MTKVWQKFHGIITTSSHAKGLGLVHSSFGLNHKNDRTNFGQILTWAANAPLITKNLPYSPNDTLLLSAFVPTQLPQQLIISFFLSHSTLVIWRLSFMQPDSVLITQQDSNSGTRPPYEIFHTGLASQVPLFWAQKTCPNGTVPNVKGNLVARLTSMGTIKAQQMSLF